MLLPRPMNHWYYCCTLQRRRKTLSQFSCWIFPLPDQYFIHSSKGHYFSSLLDHIREDEIKKWFGMRATSNDESQILNMRTHHRRKKCNRFFFFGKGKWRPSFWKASMPIQTQWWDFYFLHRILQFLALCLHWIKFDFIKKELLFPSDSSI